MDSKSTTTDSARPIPPRYWWLKRIAVGVAVLLIALGLLRWWWGVKAHRALQAEIDRLVATGQPVFAEDFRTAPIPDDQNAAILLKQAVGSLSLSKAEQTLLGQVRGDVEKYRSNAGEVRKILDRTASSRDLVRQSRGRPGADWGWYPDPSGSVPLLPSYQDLFSVLGAAAIDAHARGDDAEAVEILRDMLACGRRFQSFSILLASMLDTGASDQVAVILAACGPRLRIEGSRDEPPTNAIRPAGRRQIEDLITVLLDDRESRQAFRRGFYAERLMSLDAIRTMTGGGYSLALAPATNSWSRFVSFMLKPMFELDGVWLLRYMTAFAAAAGAPDCPAALRRLPPPFAARRVRGLRGVAHLLSSFCAPSLEGTIKESYRRSARRRMAAVSLGIRLYELGNGRLPERLDQLAPRYLPAVPLDPFADDGCGIGYRPAANPPVLYSVGPPPDKGNKAAEIIFPLRAKPPATGPAQVQTRPVNP